MGFVRVNEVETPLSEQLTQPPRRANAAHAIANSMYSNARGLRARGNRGIAHRHELRAVAAALQPRHQQKRLLLTSAPHAFQIRHQYARHGQTSRACGQARASSFPPRASTPNLRYFSQT